MPCESGPCRPNDELTQDLCYLCGQLINTGRFEELASDRIVEWFREHIERDRDRVFEACMQHYEQTDVNVTVGEANHVAAVLMKRAEEVHPVSSWHKAWFYKVAGEAAGEYNERWEEERKLKAVEDKIRGALTDEEYELWRSKND